MTEALIDVSAVPEKSRAAFQRFAGILREVAGEKLLELTAFGGWLAGDPFYRSAPARSVVVVQDFDLRLLAGLAGHGVRLGQHGLQAPLIMTPGYIAASCDVFPLEFLEIQQTGVVLLGDDRFAGLRFDPADVRLQCERELKSALIHLHQGLLSSAGKSRHLGELCWREADRAVRVLRGLLYLSGTAVPRMSGEIASQVAATAGSPLDAVGSVLGGARVSTLDEFEAFYAELSTLADYVNALDDDSRARPAPSVPRPDVPNKPAT